MEKGERPSFDYSTGQWSTEEVTEETNTFQTFQRPTTPPEYTAESMETKTTDSEPELPEESSSLIALDNPDASQECSQQLDELLPDTNETCENSPRISESPLESTEEQQLSPRTSPSNPISIQESPQHSSELVDDTLVQNESSPQRVESPDNTPGIQECSQELNELLHETIVQTYSSPSQVEPSSEPDIQECPRQSDGSPEEMVASSESSPSQEQASNVSTIQECSERLYELPCNFTTPDKQNENMPHPITEASPPTAKEQLNEEPIETGTPENASPRDTIESETTTEQLSKQPPTVDDVDTDNVPLTQELAEPHVPKSASVDEFHTESNNQQTTETREQEPTRPLDSETKQQLPQIDLNVALESGKSIPPQSASSLEIMQEQMSNEEYRCWKDLLANPDDFETWVKLLALSEKHENIIVIREIFDRFLKLYPYCYGYWRKLSDLVLRLQDWTTSQQILEIAVYSIPLSIDLWLHYGNLCINQGLDYDTIAGLYDRSLVIAGYEFRSDLLWEAAIHYHETQGQTVKVFSLLRQLIATPTQLYEKHFQRYESYLSTHSTRALLSQEEFSTIGGQIQSKQHLNEGCPSLEERVRESLMDQGRQIHAATEDEIGLRMPYEEKIKRPYFHVQPLEESQLQTWRSYLDFEISRKYKDRIVFLFERCMIVCALYEEMWIKYAKFLGAEHCQEARAVFQRGVCYIPKSVPIHLEWSLFEENLAQLEGARQLLQSIEQKVPGLIEVKSHYIAFELRHGNKDRVDEMYKQMLQESLKKYQKCSSQDENRRLTHDTYNSWAAKYAFFLSRHRGEHAVGKKLLFDAIEKDKNNPTLYFYLVDLELHNQPLDKDKVMSVLNKAIHAPLPQDVKQVLSLRKFHWSQAMGIQLDYRVMNELKALYDKSMKRGLYGSTHSVRKRPNEFDSDAYTKHSRLDASGYSGEHSQYPMNYAPTQQNYSQYYTGHAAAGNNYQYQPQNSNMPANQQWSQQYNYHQDWNYQ